MRNGFWNRRRGGHYGDRLCGGSGHEGWGRGERWIPTVCAVLGGILGAVGLYVMPGFPANDVITAAAIGMVSGLAATGAHQAVKQLCTGPDCGKTQ